VAKQLNMGRRKIASSDIFRHFTDKLRVYSATQNTSSLQITVLQKILEISVEKVTQKPCHNFTSFVRAWYLSQLSSKIFQPPLT